MSEPEQTNEAAGGQSRLTEVLDDYPAWVCLPCWNKHGRGYTEGHVCTVHTGVCGICGQTRAVTEPRDFGHLKPGWREVPNAEGKRP